MSKSLTMTKDFYKYLFFLKRSDGISLIINFVIFAISFTTTLAALIKGEIFSSFNIVGMLLFLYSLFNIIWGMRDRIKEIQGYKGTSKNLKKYNKTVILKENKTFSYEDITIDRIGNWEFENESFGPDTPDYYVQSRQLNQHLWDHDLKLNINNVLAKKPRDFILRNKDIITPFFQYKYYESKQMGRMFFNEDKLCMGSDINPNRDYVECFKSDYFTSYLTNEISTYCLIRNEDAAIIYDASNFYPVKYNPFHKQYFLQAIDDTFMNNHIGASTLAFTKDNYLVIRKQGDWTQQNMNSYVPTGSGSADFNDIQGNSLHDTIAYTMNRELWEENGGEHLNLGIKEFGRTKILGYFRWLRRGGKPEFTGITKLNVKVDQLRANPDELIDTSSKIIQDTFYIEDIDRIPVVIEQVRSLAQISLPLHMCLDSLLYYYEKRREELEVFLGLDLAGS